MLAEKVSLANAKPRRAANSEAWAIGAPQRNGFHVRKVVWGRLMADHERRDGEMIRRALILISPRRVGWSKSAEGTG